MTQFSASHATSLKVFVEGIGLLGPGLSSWAQGRQHLDGSLPYEAGRCVLPSPLALPPAERRRAGAVVKVSLAVGQEAVEASGLQANALLSVFSSSSGDAVNCHEICSALASGDRLISPTRFHNSVHNAPSGYWSISARSMATSSVVCAYDGSFAAGLLEAMTQVVTEKQPALLMAYDTDYPEPLLSVRAIPDTFGLALLLSPQPGAHSVGRLTLERDGAFTADAADRLEDATLEALRSAFPAARGLPLLRALALRQERRVVTDYLEGMQLAVHVQPC